MDARTGFLLMGATTDDVGHSARCGRWGLLTLRPYGHAMSSPAVTTWIASARAVILLMALVEGTIWGLIGRHLSPSNDALVKAAVALFAFIGIFTLIWIVDASFIMAERPLLSVSQRERSAPAHRFAFDAQSPWRWRFGVGVRVLIVAISLLVTAPLLTLVLRTGEIEAKYQERLAAAEQTRAQQRTEIAEGRARAATAQLMVRLAPLRTARDERGARIKALQRELADPAGTFKGQIEALQLEIKGLEEGIEKEVKGIGRTAGEGREWRRLTAELRAKETELAKVRAEASAQARTDAEQRRRSLAELRTLQAQEFGPGSEFARLDTEFNTITASLGKTEPDEQTTAPALKLSLGLQWTLLDEVLHDEHTAQAALRDTGQPPGDANPAAPANGWYNRVLRPWLERVAQHPRSVDGLAQAVLLMLFFSLLALKLFEPRSVKLYYSDELQLKWAAYLAGHFDQVPGFTPGTNPATRMNHIEFARAWLDYQHNPAGFFATHGERLQQQFDAGEASQQAVLAKSIMDALLTHELASLETRFHEREADREHEREALRAGLARQTGQDEARFQAQLRGMEQRLAALAAERQAETGRRAEQLAVELSGQRLAQEQRQREHEEALARERALWEGEQAAQRAALAHEQQALAQRLEAEARAHAEALAGQEQQHAAVLLRLRLEHERHLYKDRVGTLREQLAGLEARKTGLEQVLRAQDEPARALEQRAAALAAERAALPARRVAIGDELARLQGQLDGLLLAIDRTAPEQADRFASLHAQKEARERAIAAQRKALAALDEALGRQAVETAEVADRQAALAAQREEARAGIADCAARVRELEARLVAVGDGDG